VVNRVLVGNKCDDPERKVVLTEDARRFADQVEVDFIQISSGLGFALNQARVIIVPSITDNRIGHLGSISSTFARGFFAQKNSTLFLASGDWRTANGAQIWPNLGCKFGEFSCRF
jgi:hypothetical protein